MNIRDEEILGLIQRVEALRKDVGQIEGLAQEASEKADDQETRLTDALERIDRLEAGLQAAAEQLAALAARLASPDWPSNRRPGDPER